MSLVEARRPYRPARHPGVRDRWSREAILAALTEWADELGAPPRRQDWTGEDPVRAGFAQRRWMAEHPRWPSSSTVAAHFGSWGAALEAAGLPVRDLRFADTPADRVAAARRLASAGASRAEIAAELGVHRASVHNYLNAGACDACGGPVTKPRATTCGGCARERPTVPRTWTREDVRRELLGWTEEHGRAPTFRDWTPSSVWDPRLPTASVVCGLYDDWHSALLDASVGVRHRHWSDAAIRLALASLWTRLGRPPTAADLSDWDGPCLRTLHRRYGGLEAAWERLGPAPEDSGGEAPDRFDVVERDLMDLRG